jgi:hypothetical protein
MKTTSNVLQSWDKMTPLERSSFIIRHGNAVITNATTFTVLTVAGTVCITLGTTLFNAVNAEDGTTEKENARIAADLAVVEALDANKLSVESRAAGSCTIIQLAAMECTSKNTAVLAAPVVPYGFAFDKKSVIKNQLSTSSKPGENVYAGIVFGWTDETVSILKVSGDQIVITVGEIEIVANFSTTAKNTLTGLTSGDELSVEKFDVNPGGLSPGTGTVESIVP